MKFKFLLLFFLIFTNQSWIKADDIKDFQIEGMSLYDSALNYFSKSKIKNSEEDYFKDKKYTTATITSSKFEVYQQVQITYKSNDDKFVLIDINGIIDKNYQDCLNEIEIISKDFEKLFPNAKKSDLYTFPHWQDKSGNSKVSDMLWTFSNGDLIILACYNWNSAFGKKNRYVDELRISIGSKEFDDYLIGLN
jgi:hypothetical protein